MNLPVFPSHRTCCLCPLSSTPNLQSPGIPTIHLPDSIAPGVGVPAVVVVGQNPGYVEDVQGVPFVGASGVLVRGSSSPTPRKGVYVDGISLRTRSSVYLTNVARCATFKDLEPANSDYAACVPYLLQDLQQIAAAHASAPLFLLLLGAHAVSHVTKALRGKKQSLTDAMGKNGAPASFGGREWRIFATWHPAYILRNPKMVYSVADHMKLVSDSLAGITPPPSNPTVISPRMPVTTRTLVSTGL